MRGDSAAAYFGRNLGDVEDVDRGRKELTARCDADSLVVFAGVSTGGRVANSEMPLKTYFGVFGVKSAISLL